MRKKTYFYLLICLLIIFIPFSVKCQCKGKEEMNNLKMRVIFIDSGTCLSKIYKTHYGDIEPYYLVLSENLGPKDSIYKKYIVVRVYKSEFDAFLLNGEYFNLNKKMSNVIDSKGGFSDSLIVGSRCTYLLNENEKYIFVWHLKF